MTDGRCTICLDNFEAPSNTGDPSKCKYTLPCNHSYHTGCIMAHFRRGHPGCPLCRNVPEECVRRDPEDELRLMESIARLEWQKHSQMRNRWARKDGACKKAREKFWKCREEAKRLEKEYNKDITKSMKKAIREVRRDFRARRARKNRNSRVRSAGVLQERFARFAAHSRGAQVFGAFGAHFTSFTTKTRNPTPKIA